MTANLEDLPTRLLAMPERLGKAGERLLEAENHRENIAWALTIQQDELLLAGDSPICGRNEQIRDAQLRSKTLELRTELMKCEAEVRAERAVLHQVQAEFSALKAVARLLAGDNA